MIDAVNAGYRTVTFEHDQLDKILRAEGGHLAFPITIGVFTDYGIQMLGEFSTDGNSLSAQLDQNNSGLRLYRPWTGLQGAAERWTLSLNAMRRLLAAEALRPGRKVMIWVSPGWPLFSNPSGQLDSEQQQQVSADLVNISNGLLKARVTLYVVNPLGAGESVIRAGDYKPFLKPVLKPKQINLANLALQVFAIQSGGLVFTTSNDLAKDLHSCLDDATPYYEISFVPSPAHERDEYRSLEVKLANSSVTARTRLGYYAR